MKKCSHNGQSWKAAQGTPTLPYTKMWCHQIFWYIKEFSLNSFKTSYRKTKFSLFSFSSKILYKVSVANNSWYQMENWTCILHLHLEWKNTSALFQTCTTKAVLTESDWPPFLAVVGDPYSLVEHRIVIENNIVLKDLEDFNEAIYIFWDLLPHPRRLYLWDRSFVYMSTYEFFNVPFD